MVSANYDFGFESWKILAEKMCHKSSWVCIWTKSGEQILTCLSLFTGLFTAVLRKTECFDGAPKEKTQQNQYFAGFWLLLICLLVTPSGHRSNHFLPDLNRLAKLFVA